MTRSTTMTMADIESRPVFSCWVSDFPWSGRTANYFDRISVVGKGSTLLPEQRIVSIADLIQCDEQSLAELCYTEPLKSGNLIIVRENAFGTKSFQEIAKVLGSVGLGLGIQIIDKPCDEEFHEKLEAIHTNCEAGRLEGDLPTRLAAGKFSSLAESLSTRAWYKLVRSSITSDMLDSVTNKRQNKVLSARLSNHPATDGELAAELGVTKGGIATIRNDAIEALRKSIRWNFVRSAFNLQIA